MGKTLKYLLLVLGLFYAAPTWALPTPTQVTLAIYKALPTFPVGLTNQDSANPHNLVRRLLTYHLFTKGRSPYSRFDWKLTLADYLGYNEVIQSEEYPGREEVSGNVYLADQKLIDQLTPSQREQLIQALLKIYRAES